MTPDEARARLAEIIRDAGNDLSFGLGQQTVAYAQDGGKWVGDHTASGTNVAYVRDFYFRPENAIRCAAQQYGAYYRQYQDYFEAWSRYNGGSGMAYADNPNAANIARGWQEAQQYAAQEAPMQYDPETSPERQTSPYACSIRTATWMLRSLGIAVDANRMYELMVPDYVTPELGLLDGSGHGLAQLLAQHWQLEPERQYPASWDWLRAIAGKGPVGMGGAAWYHWVAVRAAEGDGLAIMNPAPGYQGVWDYLTEADFQRLGPFAAIWIDVDPAEPPENGDDMDTDRVKTIAAGPILENIDSALAAIDVVLTEPHLLRRIERKLLTARENLEYGAKPAAQTLARGET